MLEYAIFATTEASDTFLVFFICPCFVVQYLALFLAGKRERAGCFTLIAVSCHVANSVLCFYFMVP